MMRHITPHACLPQHHSQQDLLGNPIRISTIRKYYKDLDQGKYYKDLAQGKYYKDFFALKPLRKVLVQKGGVPVC